MKLAVQAEVKLRNLIERGALPASQCGRAFLDLIAPLFASGAVVEQKSSAGRQFATVNLAVVREFHRQRFPLTDWPLNAGSRIIAVGRFRDSKAMANDTGEIVSFRVWRDDALFKAGKPVSAVSATAMHGVFSFLFADKCAYELRGVCALVENPAMLFAFEQLRLDIPLALYGGGRISGRVGEWLAGQKAAGFRLIHFPDYDPVGMNEHLRLRALLGDRVTLHLPDDLAACFDRFGNSQLVRRRASQALLPKLRSSVVAEVKFVVELMDRYNAGLEQEALLLSSVH